MCKLINSKSALLLVQLLLLQLLSLGQSSNSISGILKDQTSGEVIPFASVVLLNRTDSTQLSGTMSTIHGEFKLTPANKKSGYIKISHLSYRDTLLPIAKITGAAMGTPVIFLNNNAVSIDEILINAEVIKAKSNGAGTTYFMNNALKKHSTSAIDIVKRLPGIHIDFSQNLKAQDNGKIVLFVDGKPHKLEYLQQISAQKISKIDISNSPGAQYGADVGTIIHIFLKKADKGVSGQLYSDIPTSKSIIYMFPKFNLQLAKRNYQFSVAYNGKMNYFDISETNEFVTTTNNEHLHLLNSQTLRQKTWSHRLSYSAGAQFDKKQLSFYGNYNPYSQELDGNILAQNNLTNENILQASRNDQDINHQLYNSVNYQQIFTGEAKLNVNLQHGFYNGRNSVTYDSVDGANISRSNSRPTQQSVRFATDLHVPLSKTYTLNLGTKATHKTLENAGLEKFAYQSAIIASYATCTYQKNKLEINSGLRLEYERTFNKSRFSRKGVSLLPDFAANYQFNRKHTLMLRYRRSIIRPHRYQLTPLPNIINPFQTIIGNNQLNNQLHNEMSLTYHLKPGNDYYAFRLFYNCKKDVISQFTIPDETNMLTTTFQNAGNIYKYGISLDVALKAFKHLTIYSNIKVYNISTRPISALENHVPSKDNKAAYEISASALLSLPKDFTASIQFQYVSPQKHIQRITSADPLCFASIEKHFTPQFKVGITGAVTISEKLLYSGEKVSGADFTQKTQGNIHLNKIPVWFNLTYNFSAGKNIVPGKHKIKDAEQIRQKGF